MDMTATGLWQAIERGIRLRSEYLSTWKLRLGKWVGNKYRLDWKTKPQLENYAHSYIAFLLPQLVFDRPVAAVEPLSDARDTVTAEGMEAMVNGWIKVYDYKRKVLKGCARDMMLGWAITYRGIDWTTPLGQRGNPVFSKQIAQADYVVDPDAFGWQNREWEAHSFEMSKPELLRDPLYAQWQDVIATLQVNGERKQREDLPGKSPDGAESKKDTITLWQVYLRKAGVLITLAENSTKHPAIVREARYIGPVDGPYTMWGVYEVPGQLYPLSPLAATEEAQDDLNDHAFDAYKSARRYKRVATYAKGAGDADAKAMQAAKSGQLIGLSIPNSVQEVELGGISAEQMNILTTLRDRLDRNMGFADAQRGIPNSNTATANQLSQNNSDLRVDFMVSCLTECAEDDLRAAAWYFYNTPEIVMDLSVVDRHTDQPRSITFMGGPVEQEEDLTPFIEAGMTDQRAIYGVGRDWTDYHLRILAESMVKVADPVRQKRALDEWNMVMGIIQVYGPQAVNIRRVVKRYGRAFNENDLDQILLSPAFLSMLVDPLSAQPIIAPQMPGMGGPGMMQQMGGGMMGGGGQVPTGGMMAGQPQGMGFAPGVARSPVTAQGIAGGVQRGAMAGV